MTAARAFARRKPIVAYKAGLFVESAAAALFRSRGFRMEHDPEGNAVEVVKELPGGASGPDRRGRPTSPTPA